MGSLFHLPHDYHRSTKEIADLDVLFHALPRLQPFILSTGHQKYLGLPRLAVLVTHLHMGMSGFFVVPVVFRHFRRSEKFTPSVRHVGTTHENRGDAGLWETGYIVPHVRIFVLIVIPAS